MKQLFLFISLFIFVFLPSFIFAQDNVVRNVITETIPTQSNNNKNNNFINPNPTVTPTIIKKETLNIFQRIKLFFSDFFKRLFIKKETINKTTKLLIPTQITKLTPTINISQSMADSKQILVDLEKALNVTAEITEKWSSINWFGIGKEIAPLICQAFTIGTSASSHTGKYGNFAQYPDLNILKDVTEDALKPLQSEVNEFFLSNGFQKDDRNTFRSSEFPVALFMGYTKGDLKCLVTLYSRSSLFGNFFCGIVDQTRLAWRKELTSAINTTNDPNIVVSVNKIVGDYAQGFVSSPTGRGGGAGWYAVKINGQWKEVLRGQQMTLTSCKLLQQYNFPKEIIDLEHSDVCSNNPSQTTQTPTSTIESKAKVLVADFWGNRLYCDPEVAPTMIPLCNSDFSQTPACPSTNPQNIDIQAVDCYQKQNLYQAQIRNQTNKQCPISSSIEGYDKQNYEMIQKYCTVITITPRAAKRY
ncbi:conserved exported hypothetical protein [Candidatus Roizmanbacteria bacterium]|nr:conserved exported hypothetical protein [Candidatus Roizmanbacteria bacterium]